MTLQQRLKEAISNRVSDDAPQCENAAIACESITLEMMGEFAEWCGDNEYFYNTKYKRWEDNDEKEWLTTLELIQKFLKRG